MKFTDLTALLPCHSLEDFPLYHEGTEADQLLAGWCAAWHPALIAASRSVPAWHRLDIPPETLGGRLLILPAFCHDRLPAGYSARVHAEGGCLVRAESGPAAVAAALEVLDGGDAGVAPQTAESFLDLAFCRLQIELLTRQMRYSTNIDETHFQNETIAAADAALVHDDETCQQHLNRCFETLYEARKHFYPVDVYLLDLTLVAATTLGGPLAAELADATPTNLLLPIGLLESMRSNEPNSWQALLTALDEGRACVPGNEVEETELPILPLQAALANLQRGVQLYESLLGRRPQVFARRRAGLWPGLVQLLSKLGYQGALHVTLDDGRFPLPPQSKTRWEGLDSSVLDIFGSLPSDASKPETLLGFSRKMADSMDNDHVATVAFAHWPRANSPWYDSLRRIAARSEVLGKFKLLDDYFSHTDMPGRLSKFEPDEYRTPYLKQAIIRRQSDPISRLVRAHREQAVRAAAGAISALGDLVAGSIAKTVDSTPACSSVASTCSEDEVLSAPLAALARVLPPAQEAGEPRWLVVNPLSFSRQIGIEFPLQTTSTATDRSVTVVEVPPLGFAWVAPTAAHSASRAKPIANENVLRNEFFEATISRATGGLQSLFSFTQRGNQLSQQIAFRLPAQAAADGAWDSGGEAPYSAMQAEAVEVTAATPLFGEIVSRGQLVDPEGRRIAGFRQTMQAWAKSRVMRIDIELTDLEEPRADAWNSYYAARFAWPDEAAELWRGVGWFRHKTGAGRLEAPEYIDIENASGRISLLTGGLPYHRRAGGRMLDSLLVVRGETARRFSLGIAVDAPQPAAAAQEFVVPTLVYFDPASQKSAVVQADRRAAGGWFFHVDAKNVIATDWWPLADPAHAEGHQVGGAGKANERIRGFRARLLETAGRGGRVTLRAFRGVASARQVDFLGQTLLDVPLEDDKIFLDFAAGEWIEVEAVWK